MVCCVIGGSEAAKRRGFCTCALIISSDRMWNLEGRAWAAFYKAAGPVFGLRPDCEEPEKAKPLSLSAAATSFSASV